MKNNSSLKAKKNIYILAFLTDFIYNKYDSLFILPILGMRIPLSARAFPLLGNPLPIFDQAGKAFLLWKNLLHVDNIFFTKSALTAKRSF